MFQRLIHTGYTLQNTCQHSKNHSYKTHLIQKLLQEEAKSLLNATSLELSSVLQDEDPPITNQKILLKENRPFKNSKRNKT